MCRVGGLVSISQNEYLKSEMLVLVSCLFPALGGNFQGDLHGASVNPLKM